MELKAQMVVKLSGTYTSRLMGMSIDRLIHIYNKEILRESGSIVWD